MSLRSQIAAKWRSDWYLILLSLIAGFAVIFMVVLIVGTVTAYFDSRSAKVVGEEKCTVLQIEEVNRVSMNVRTRLDNLFVEFECEGEKQEGFGILDLAHRASLKRLNAGQRFTRKRYETPILGNVYWADYRLVE